MSASINQMGLEIPVEWFNLKQNIHKTIQGQEIKQGVLTEKLLVNKFCDNDWKKWSRSKNLKNDLAEFPDPFLNYKEKGFSAELMGTETVDGSSVFKIKLTKTPMIVDGEVVPNVSTYYFDSENYFQIMVHEEVMRGPGKGMIMESRMGNYQEVQGLYMPFSMTQGIKGQPGQPVTINSIEINPSIDESEFEFPDSVSDESN